MGGGANNTGAMPPFQKWGGGMTPVASPFPTPLNTYNMPHGIKLSLGRIKIWAYYMYSKDTWSIFCGKGRGGLDQKVSLLRP